MFKLMSIFSVFLLGLMMSAHADYIVKFKEGSSGGLHIGLGYYRISSSDFSSHKSAGNIISFETDQVLGAYPVQESPRALTWGLEAIDAREAWESTKGDKNVIVAVIDTGVDYNHEQLRNNIWINKGEIADNGKDDDKNGYIDDVRGWDFEGKDNDPMDKNMHGTHCAGVIASSGYGIAPNVTIMPLQFLSRSGSGNLSDALIAIKYAVDNGAKIISNSWGGGGYSQALFDMIKYAEERGVLFVAAAGNNGDNTDRNASYPGGYEIDNIISVGASTIDGQVSSFSNYGKKTVHVFAPGSDIISTVPNNKIKSLSGTSMACPFVSGLAALILSSESDCDYSCVKNKIIDNVKRTDNFVNKSISGGIINAADSLK